MTNYIQAIWFQYTILLLFGVSNRLAAVDGCSIALRLINLSTARTELRKVAPIDFPSISDILTNPEVGKVSGDGAYSVEDAKEFLNTALVQNNAQLSQWVTYAVISKDSKKVIGFVQFSRFNDADKSAQIAFDLDPLFWNQGYMTEIGKA